MDLIPEQLPIYPYSRTGDPIIPVQPKPKRDVRVCTLYFVISAYVYYGPSLSMATLQGLLSEPNLFLGPSLIVIGNTILLLPHCYDMLFYMLVVSLLDMLRNLSFLELIILVLPLFKVDIKLVPLQISLPQVLANHEERPPNKDKDGVDNVPFAPFRCCLFSQLMVHQDGKGGRGTYLRGRGTR